MNCPKCNIGDTKVYDSRQSKSGRAMRRRRECLACKYRFTTVEEAKILDLNVKKRSGQIVPFSEDKLEYGIRKAFNKRPVESTKIQDLTQQVLEDILALDHNSSNPISSVKIGKLTLKRLKEADKVAFICYSAMFSNFESVEDFIKIIN